MTRTLFAIAALSLLAAPSADAQYFGQNKVRYGRHDFHVLNTPHFDIYYYPQEEAATRLAAIMAERWYARLSAVLDHTFARRQPIILYASHAQFAQTAIVPGVVPEGVGGFTDHLAGRVVLPFAAGLAESDHVLGHEIVHAFQRDILKRRGRSLSTLPLWFSEGMAEQLSIGRLDPNTRMWLRDAVNADTLPSIAQLDDPRWFPYRYGQGLWQFLVSTYGDAVVNRALRSTARTAAGRLRDATGAPVESLSTAWHAYLASAVAAGAIDESLPAGSRRIVTAHEGGRLNVAPRLSPDGRLLVFLSERDGHAVDVYLARTESGEIVRKLTSAAVDPHFESLQFVESAGAWDATGAQFALATVRDGGAALIVYEMPDGLIRREIPVAGVDQLFGPTWSPDGSHIAFSGLKGGLTDLFVLDIASGAVRQLTADPYSDLQPAWSPDGRSLAFATDRFSTSIDALSFGHYQLATLDLASGITRPLAALDQAKAIDPQWAPDGRTLYFVSDAGSVSNIHRLDVASGRITRLTGLTTGVSGITAMSPSLSVGAGGRTLAASIYRHGAYEIWTIDTATLDTPLHITAEAPLLAMRTTPPTSMLPPDSTAVLPTDEAFASRVYAPGLSIAQIGTPYLSAGGGAFGSFLRGGVSMQFSDLLGMQDIGVALQVGKDSTDNAVVVAYTNRRTRWNWGISAGRIPALVGLSEQVRTTTASEGDALLVRERTVEQQVHRQVAATASYPFSRAQRLEASLGIDAIAFEQRLTTATFSAVDRRQRGDDETQRVAAPGALVVQPGLALVHDTAVFGGTSPVLGQRYRLAVAPSFGDVHAATISGDFRKYVMPARRFTVAWRGQTVARLGRDRSDPRLLPLVWNMRDMVRGYDTDAALSRTTRFALANIELRTPFTKGGTATSRALPIEAFAFADCGRFWFSSPTSGPEGSRTACSAGAGTRLNAAGLVFEFNVARPIASGWRFGVNFRPGF